MNKRQLKKEWVKVASGKKPVLPCGKQGEDITIKCLCFSLSDRESDFAAYAVQRSIKDREKRVNREDRREAKKDRAYRRQIARRIEAIGGV